MRRSLASVGGDARKKWTKIRAVGNPQNPLREDFSSAGLLEKDERGPPGPGPSAAAVRAGGGLRLRWRNKKGRSGWSGLRRLFVAIERLPTPDHEQTRGSEEAERTRLRDDQVGDERGAVGVDLGRLA